MERVLRPKMEYSCHISTEAAQIPLSKIVYAALFLMNYFPPHNHLLIDETLPASRYSIAISV